MEGRLVSQPSSFPCFGSGAGSQIGGPSQDLPTKWQVGRPPGIGQKAGRLDLRIGASGSSTGASGKGLWGQKLDSNCPRSGGSVYTFSHLATQLDMPVNAIRDCRFEMLPHLEDAR